MAFRRLPRKRRSVFPLLVLVGWWWIAAAGCTALPPFAGETPPLPAPGEIPDTREGGSRLPPLLSLDDACRIAGENNPDFNALFHSVAAAEARYRQALGAYLPELHVGFAAGQNLVDRGNLVNPQPATIPFASNFDTDLTAQAGLLLFDGLRREFGALAARGEAAATAEDRRDAFRKLRRSVACAFCDALLADALLAVADADVEFQRSCLEQAKVRYRNGFIAERDYLGFRIDLNRALVRLVSARSRREVTRCALAALMGCRSGALPPETRLLPPPGTPAERSAVPIDFYLELALLRRPDLAAARLRRRIARYREFQGIGAFAPVVNLVAGGGSYLRAQGGREYVLGYGLIADWQLLPLWTRWQRLRELREERSIARLRAVAVEIAALSEVESAYSVRESAAEALGFYRESLAWVRRQRELVAVEYWSGDVTITRLRGAQNDLVGAESGCAAALAEFCKAEARLLAAVGGEW